MINPVTLFRHIYVLLWIVLSAGILQGQNPFDIRTSRAPAKAPFTTSYEKIVENTADTTLEEGTSNSKLSSAVTTYSRVLSKESDTPQEYNPFDIRRSNSRPITESEEIISAAPLEEQKQGVLKKKK